MSTPFRITFRMHSGSTAQAQWITAPTLNEALAKLPNGWRSIVGVSVRCNAPTKSAPHGTCARLTTEDRCPSHRATPLES